MKKWAIQIANLGSILLISAPAVLGSDYDQPRAKDTIEKWNDYGMIKGDENGDIKPDAFMTRAELAALLDRIFKFKEAEGEMPYIDIITSPNKWYVEPVSKVTELDLMHIRGLFFFPDAPITREEAAYAIAKAYELIPLEVSDITFKDEERISPWALEAVRTMAQYHYISGTAEGNFMPQDTLTREEVMTILGSMTSQVYSMPGTYTATAKGNVIINSSQVILKDMTIEGNLYITSGVSQTILEDVTVTGTVYVNGGSLELSGHYQEVCVRIGVPVTFTAGKIKKLVVGEVGTSLKVEKDAVLDRLVQNKPLLVEGSGSIGGSPIGSVAMPKLMSVRIDIDGSYTALPVSDNQVVIDMPSLRAQFGPSAHIEGVHISANTDEANIISNTGSIQVASNYRIQELENQLGIMRAIAIHAGLSPDLVVGQLLEEKRITIGDLLEGYAQTKAFAAQLGYQFYDSYTFECYLTNSQGRGELIYITLHLQ